MALEVRISRKVALFLLEHDLLLPNEAEIMTRGLDGSKDWVGTVSEDYEMIRDNEDLKSFVISIDDTPSTTRLKEKLQLIGIFRVHKGK